MTITPDEKPAQTSERDQQSFWGRASRSGTLIAGATILMMLVVMALLAPVIAPYSPTAQNLTGGLLPPSPEHWFGTDQLGRDAFSRVLYAARTDLAIAFTAAIAPFFVGVTAGLLAGYFGKRTDWVISRVVDTVIAFPFYVIVIAIAFALGAGATGIVVAFALVGWVGYARVVRLLTASMRQEEWVRAARGAGLSHARVLFKHVLPNVLPQAVVLFMNEVLLIMVAIVTLGYLGLGIQPPAPDWGTMIADAQPFVTTKWWLAALPGLAVVVTGVGLSLAADGLGDALRVRDALPRWRRFARPLRAVRSVRLAQPAQCDVSTTPLKPGEVRATRLTIAAETTGAELVRTLSFDVAPGAALGIVGESGSGKSLTLRALLGLLPAGVAVTGGSVAVGGTVGMVFQDPLTALDPRARVGAQLGEAVWAADRSASRAARSARVRELFELVRLPGERVVRAYPHQLSGGQRQRVVIALALAARPRVLLCDEPTTALDVTVQREVLSLLSELRRERGLTLIFVSHDLAVVSAMCDRIIVMRHGVVVETGLTAVILSMPKSAYARELIASVPQLPPVNVLPELNLNTLQPPKPLQPLPQPNQAALPTLEARGLAASYRRGVLAIENINLAVAPGGALGIVGESGSGKTTLARALVGQHPVARGELRLDGVALETPRSRVQLRDIQLVPQDPTSSLNPRLRVGQALGEVVMLAGRAGKTVRYAGGGIPAEVSALLGRVGLDPDLAHRYPHELSGGQRQRVAIARALAARPRVIVADEPTSALDVSAQAGIVELLNELRETLGLALVFVSHDLAVVQQLCNEVIVMRSGRIEEHAGPEFFTAPRSQYGRALLEAVPRIVQ